MKAIICNTLTGIDSLSLEDSPEPSLSTPAAFSPKPSVRLRVRACGVNFADSLITRGQYQVQPQPPFSPGFEVAGEVLEVGADVTDVAVGDRVMAVMPHGGYAEQALVAHNACVRIPEHMPWTDAAAFPVVFGTSHIALWHRARLQPGETLVVHGASGGVGLTAVAIGKWMGARVIATANGPEKGAIARQHGADETIDTAHEDVRLRIKEMTDGRGADVMYDPVGGDLFHASLRSIAFEGRIVVIGFAGGTVPQIPANHVLVKNVDVIGLNWPAYVGQRPTILRDSFQQLLAGYRSGALQPHVSATYPLDRAVEALQQVITRKSTGKVVITVG